ncbi:MAG: hypothetical protein LAO56_23100 [Acidobacteriia bacterium]|nr:hypothetical protein [Terriglobia bacterium]
MLTRTLSLPTRITWPTETYRRRYSVDLPSPVEGALTAVNRAALENPELVTTDPFCEGWIAVIKSHCFATDKKNLMHGAMAAQWMRDSFVELRE